jgi:hypothetical protein
MSISAEQITLAEQRGKRLQREYAALDAIYDEEAGRVRVLFPTDLEISFAPQNVEGLQSATPKQLQHIELSPSGLSLYFPEVDADVYIPALMHNIFGSKAWMAELGKTGGAVRSERKASASRENGRLGGRPPKRA